MHQREEFIQEGTLAKLKRQGALLSACGGGLTGAGPALGGRYDGLAERRAVRGHWHVRFNICGGGHRHNVKAWRP